MDRANKNNRLVCKILRAPVRSDRDVNAEIDERGKQPFHTASPTPFVTQFHSSYFFEVWVPAR